MPRFEPRDTQDLTNSAYQDYILQGVSRTFALTIPQLPEALREAVGNAYLLCRIADTIEDDPLMLPEQKAVLSQQFIEVVAGERDAQPFADTMSAALAKEVPIAEKDLIANTARVIALTRSFSGVQQAAMHRCVAIMAEGMSYYQAHLPSSGLKDIPALDRYCYHVAGVVGEMLTELYCDYSEAMQSNRDLLMELSLSFGQGLQMTNILKDIWDDHSRNVYWLPRTLFEKHGIELKNLTEVHSTAAFADVLNELIGVAHAHLQNALRYTLLIPAKETGMRRFCFWAIGMALSSLRKIYLNPEFSDSRDVKISRRAVSGVITLTNLSVRSDKLLTALFKFTGRGLPAPIDSPIESKDICIKNYLEKVTNSDDTSLFSLNQTQSNS